MHIIDATNLNCPAPVLKAKDFIEKNNPKNLKIIVDNEAAQQNIQRFLETKGFKTKTKKQEENFVITGIFDDKNILEKKIKERVEQKKIMVMCTSNRIGTGDNELGEKLMISFIKTLKEMGKDLWRLVFVNNGVKLVIDDSLVLECLKKYEDNGLDILVCGTCLNHFNLIKRKKIGQTTNMLDIVSDMLVADKVINI